MRDHNKEQLAHAERVASIKRRGTHDRVVSKLHYWKSLECDGYVLKSSERIEVTVLTEMLDKVRAEMIAAGQPPGDYALLTCMGLS